jgi:uncharacterized protein DUF2510
MADASEVSRASRDDGRDDVVDAPTGAGSGSDPGAGWFKDPTKHHELRYFDGSVWTRQVSNFGVLGEDPYWAAPAWYRDPSRRFQYRYWDDDGWTMRAVTRGEACADPVDAAWSPPLPHHARDDVFVVEVRSTVRSRERITTRHVRDSFSVLPSGVGALWPGTPWGRL